MSNSFLRSSALDPANVVLVSPENPLPGAIYVGGAAVGLSNPLPATGLITNPSGSFTRPADTTAYAIADLMANSTTAGSVVPVTITVARSAAGSEMLRRCKVAKTSTTTGATVRVHLFHGSATITCANGDNGAFSTDQVANYLGAFDVTFDRAFTDGASGFGVPVVGNEISIKHASGTDAKCLFEARTAYTPTSGEVFTVTFDDLPN